MDRVLIPAMFLGILTIGAFARIDVYETFVKGAKKGLGTTLRVLPYLCGAMLLVGALQGSGALEALTGLMAPALEFFGIPPETSLLMAMRPFSGAAALGALSDIIQNHGPDSEAGRVAAVMLGSTETVFYTVSVYLGAARIRASRYIIPISLLTSLVGAVLSAYLCRIL